MARVTEVWGQPACFRLAAAAPWPKQLAVLAMFAGRSPALRPSSFLQMHTFHVSMPTVLPRPHSPGDRGDLALCVPSLLRTGDAEAPRSLGLCRGPAPRLFAGVPGMSRGAHPMPSQAAPSSAPVSQDEGSAPQELDTVTVPGDTSPALRE